MNVEKKERSDIFTEHDLKEYLNDTCEEVKICGYFMLPGDILCEMDNTAFREVYNDYLAMHVEDVYICGNCGEEFADEEEAERCCKFYNCYVCGEFHKTVTQAEMCCGEKEVNYVDR